MMVIRARAGRPGHPLIRERTEEVGAAHLRIAKVVARPAVAPVVPSDALPGEVLLDISPDVGEQVLLGNVCCEAIGPQPFLCVCPALCPRKGWIAA